MMKIAVMGYGTVGSGVVKVLEDNREAIAQRMGQEVSVKSILDLRKFPGDPMEERIVHDFSEIINDSEIQIVVETMGGEQPAADFVRQCLEAGKHVVTSNKALVAAHGTELLETARNHHVNFLFEASVGGGIPVIRPLYESLSGDVITSITGIVNGTTNYILTKMEREKMGFQEALLEAQRLGYAEKNPEADVTGADTCRKLAILTSIAVGKFVDYKEIFTKGIEHITEVDFQYAEFLGRSIRLLGCSEPGDGNTSAWVAPVMLGKETLLGRVDDVFNGIVIRGNMAGETFFYGSGAGSLPTASAVVSDILDEMKHPDGGIMYGWNQEKIPVADYRETVHRNFIRIAGKPEEHFDELVQVLGSLETVTPAGFTEYAVLTEPMKEADYQAAAAGRNDILQRIWME